MAVFLEKTVEITAVVSAQVIGSQIRLAMDKQREENEITASLQSQHRRQSLVIHSWACTEIPGAALSSQDIT